MNKQLQKQNLKQLMRLTLINILNAKGTIYTHYKLMGAKGVIYTYYKQQERELNEKKETC
jgi:hypothetical protein